MSWHQLYCFYYPGHMLAPAGIHDVCRAGHRLPASRKLGEKWQVLSVLMYVAEVPANAFSQVASAMQPLPILPSPVRSARRLQWVSSVPRAARGALFPWRLCSSRRSHSQGAAGASRFRFDYPIQTTHCPFTRPLEPLLVINSYLCPLTFMLKTFPFCLSPDWG